MPPQDVFDSDDHNISMGERAHFVLPKWFLIFHLRQKQGEVFAKQLDRDEFFLLFLFCTMQPASQIRLLKVKNIYPRRKDKLLTQKCSKLRLCSGRKQAINRKNSQSAFNSETTRWPFRKSLFKEAFKKKEICPIIVLIFSSGEKKEGGCKTLGI